MIPKDCKRLAEVDFPIAVVSKHAAREKSIRHGHPSTLHLWWARRPLAACRAVLLALLLPDPCDEHCPEDFKAKMRSLLPRVQGNPGPNDEDLRKALLKFIGDFANWDLSSNSAYLEVSRGLVKAAHPEETPLVVDPFAGGGSIPLEALRLGCETFASDLNPVACLILKVMLEDIPRHGAALAEELRKVGAEIKKEAERELAEFYPVDADGARPIAYLWARTVRCEFPDCGAEIPLVRSFWLSKKANRKRALRYKVASGTGFQPVTDIPETFQPVNPWKSSELAAQKRHLPHLQVPEATYFVTFRCRKGLELPEAPRDVALSALTHWNASRIELDAAVVMPDHVHAMFRITDHSTLGDLLHSIKSFSASRINKLLGREGAFWLDENFDHIIRHETEWKEKFEYIRQNPVKAGLASGPEQYRWLWQGSQSKRGRSDRLEACPTVEFEIFEPKTEEEVPKGTVTRAKATCLCCHRTTGPDRVRAQLAAQRGGADVEFDGRGKRIGGARLLAVVTLHPGEQGRHYRLQAAKDYEAVWKAKQRLDQVAAKPLANGLNAIPDEPLPPSGTLGFRVQRYGMLQWGNLFTARQKLALIDLSTSARGLTVDPVQESVVLAFSRTVNAVNSLCRWHTSGEKHEGVYSRQALPIVWDFSEANPLSDATGGFAGALDWVATVIECAAASKIGQVNVADACESPLPDEAVSVWFTDPPYYDAIPYADLSDFLFVWLKRTLVGHPVLRDPYDASNPLTPKAREAVQDEVKQVDGHPKDRVFFEETMAKAFAEGRRVLKADGIASVVFAHKTTEGWEALLSGMVRGGWVITGSWPIATEMGSRLRARESAALATSVHLVCRPRVHRQDACATSGTGFQPVGDWAEVLRELPKRVGDWMERLQAEHVRGADLVFACIGPALEIFSRYSKVETAEGREVTLAEYLAKVW
ncbi:MAG: DUF1156 domain-containing protein, partial [Acidobacteria bacterium]|nr:DUF1156 domain-containing protein [Acidobacteriota bacterium]